MSAVTFSHPAFLWLLPLVALLVRRWVRTRRPAVRFSDTSLFRAGRGTRARWATRGGAALRGLAGVALLLACAGPRIPDERTRLPAESIGIMTVIDVSHSMQGKVSWAAGEPEITRLEAARRAFKLFVAGGTGPDGTRFPARPSDQIGLIAFAAIPRTVCPLTLNHSSALLPEVERLEPLIGVQAGTNVGDALAEAVIRLDAASGPTSKIVILLSDGEHNQSKEAGLRPLQAAQLAANLGFKVYTVDTGGDPQAVSDPEARAERQAGRRTLREIAEMTGGRAFDANDSAGLLTAFREIDTRERARVETFQYRRYFEFYAACGAVALGAILAAHLLERTVWRTTP